MTINIQMSQQPDTMSHAEEISNRLIEMTDFIENAQAELQNGNVVNLSHLDDEVAQLCDRALKLPPEEAAKIRPVMATMISKLEELSLALKEFQDNLQSGGGAS